MIASPEYRTIPKPVNIPFVMSWKNTMIAYDTQNNRLVTSLVRAAHKSKAITSKTARTPSCV